MAGKAINIAGRRFGMLVAVSLCPSVLNKRTRWICRCDCGAEKDIVTQSLIRGVTTSCGCAIPNKTRDQHTTHGKSKSVDYSLWTTMLQRCSNKKHASYKDYGAKGISVCERWTKFENFASDMLPRPFEHASIERMDNNKGYSKENCEWIPLPDQALNKSTSRLLEINGEIKTVVEWSRQYGAEYGTVLSRLNHGYSPVDALTFAPWQRRN